MQNLESARSALVVTTSDANKLPRNPTKGIYVGVSGDVKVDMMNGETVTYKSLSAGIVHPIAAAKVYATGTTATDIIAVY